MTSLPHPRTLRQRLHILAKLIRMEFTAHSGLPRLDLLSSGFLSARAGLYPFDTYPKDLFLSDYEVEMRVIGLNARATADLLEHKLCLHALAAQGGLPAVMPPLVGLLLDGVLISLNSAKTDAQEEGPQLIAKPLVGRGGEDVVRFERSAVPANRGAYLIEAAVQAHPYAKAIFPGAINTLRITTLRERATADVLVMSVVHRFGVEASQPTDNFKRGGLSALVREEDDRLTRAIALPRRGARRQVHVTHPDTAALIEGVKVPLIEEARAMAIGCARALPGLAYAGWDIAITPSGPVLIEGNANLPHPNLTQAHRPVLEDARVRAFFTDYGVLSTRRAARLAARYPATRPAAAEGWRARQDSNL